jgi:hypothetical protein
MSELEVLPSEAEETTTDGGSDDSNVRDRQDYILHEQIAALSLEEIEDESEQDEGPSETDSSEARPAASELDGPYDSVMEVELSESEGEQEIANPSEEQLEQESDNDPASEVEDLERDAQGSMDDGSSSQGEPQTERAEVEENETDESVQVSLRQDTVHPHIRPGTGLPALELGGYFDAVSLLIRWVLCL